MALPQLSISIPLRLSYKLQGTSFARCNEADNHSRREDPKMALWQTSKSSTKAPGVDKAEAANPRGQGKRLDTGQFQLQVDRQTKISYGTYEAAERAGMAIKQTHPIVQVAIYNAGEGSRKIIELPDA